MARFADEQCRRVSVIHYRAVFILPFASDIDGPLN